MPVRGSYRVCTEVYDEAEADAIVARAASQDSPRWAVGQVLLCTLRKTGASSTASRQVTRWSLTGPS